MGIEEERERIAADPERTARVAEHIRRNQEAVGAHLDLDVLEADARKFLREHQAENLNPARRMTDAWAWALTVVDLVAEARRLRRLAVGSDNPVVEALTGRELSYGELVEDLHQAEQTLAELRAEVLRLRGLCGHAVDALLVEYGPLGPAHPHVPTVLWDLAESAGRPNLREEMNEMARVDDDF